MQEELAEIVLRHAPRPGTHRTPLQALQIVRADATYERVHSIHKPSLCFIVQGSKVVTVGQKALRYGDGQFLFSSVELPVAGEVIEATRRRPYLVLVLEVEPSLVFELITATGSANGRKAHAPGRAIFVGHERAMSSAFQRLVACLSDPTDVLVLAPSIVREIVYRLLQSRYGDAVREVGIADSQTQRIAGVIEHIKGNLAEPQSMSALARRAGMSLSSFHAHFRKVTTLTPLQYQKQLRLHEARRLLLTTSTSAADAGFRVGYESASQFSREYARFFGLPPLSDARRVKQ